MRNAGADGIIMAEPLAGLLSPELATEFSEPYVKEVFDAVKSDDFAAVYHNCGNGAVWRLPTDFIPEFRPKMSRR